MASIYSNFDDVGTRIREIRRLKDILSNEEDFWILCRNELAGKKDHVVDERGRLVGPREKKKETTYRLVKAAADDQAEMRERMRKAFGVETWRG